MSSPPGGGMGFAPPILFPWRLVTHQRGRTAIAAVAIAFAVLVMFMQLGFYGATVDTALSMPAHFDADLYIVSTSFVQLSDSGDIPRARLTQALGAPGVANVTPLYTRFGIWRTLEGEGSCIVQVFSYPLNERRPVRLEGMDEIEPLLNESATVSVDKLTQPNCPTITDTIKLGQQVTRVVGTHRLGLGFLAGSSIVMSPNTFGRLFPDQPLDRVNIGMVYIEPGRRPADVAASVRTVLPPDTEVMTLEDLRALQLRYWVDNTAVGTIFGLGTAVGFLVGFVVVYQILSSGVRNQLSQYAVLRAIGSADQKIYGTVLIQGWILTLFGFIPGLVGALGIYAGMEKATLIEMPMPLGRLLTVLGLTLVLSTFSGLLSLRKLESADPAALF